MTDELITRHLRSLPPMGLPSLLKEEWISALQLASAWKFFSVKAMAENVLERPGSLSPLEKILIGRELFKPTWVINGFVGLVQATTITDEEALKIDLGAATTAYKLFRIRELRIAGNLSSAKTKMEEILKEELVRLRTQEEMLGNTDEKSATKIMGR